MKQISYKAIKIWMGAQLYLLSDDSMFAYK